MTTVTNIFPVKTPRKFSIFMINCIYSKECIVQATSKNYLKKKDPMKVKVLNQKTHNDYFILITKLEVFEKKRCLSIRNTAS